jgi:hypothetical protein
VSVIPRDIAVQVHASIEPSDVRLHMYDGREVEVEVAEFGVEVLHYRFAGSFAVVEADHAVLGRNILNLLFITLDGPNQQWSASPDARSHRPESSVPQVPPRCLENRVETVTAKPRDALARVHARARMRSLSIGDLTENSAQ